jgi:hypothetical protein
MRERHLLMAIASAGYDGTVTQEDWAAMASFFGSDTGVATETDLVVTGVSGTRVASVSPGMAWGWGVIDTLTGDNSLTFAANSSGSTRWDAVVLRRNWGTGISTLNVVTGSSVETVPSLTVNPGSQADQVIALVAVPNGATSLVGATVRRYVQWPVQATAGLYPPHTPSYMQRWVDLNAAGVTKQWTGSAWVDPEALPAWIPLTLAAGYTSNGVPVSYRVIHGNVEFRGIVRKTVAHVAGLNPTFATLPAGARPPVTYRGNCDVYATPAGVHSFVQVGTTGACQTYFGAAGQVDVFVSGLRFPV